MELDGFGRRGVSKALMARKKSTHPNRIAEFRDAAGLSQQALAKLLRTTQPTIARLETGTMELTESWMRVIAKQLGVRPADLLAEATLAEFEDELEPYLPEASDELAAPLAARNLFYYKVLSNAVENAGISKGKIVLFDKSAGGTERRVSGDIVFVRVHKSADDMRNGFSLIRQYLAPGLLVTNRRGSNVAFRETGETFSVTVRGVLVPGGDLIADK